MTTKIYKADNKLTFSILFLYAATGILAGFLAGLFGVGGGLIIVPALLYCFFIQGFDPAVSMHMAIGTSLATIILTSISSMRAHHAHGAVQWQVIRHMSLGILIGGFLGALVAKNLRSELLQIVFAIFEILVAIKLLSNAKVTSTLVHLPGKLVLFVVGIIISAISAIVGIGGGTLSVPFLRWSGFSIQKSIATSAGLGLPIAISGTLAFIWAGSGHMAIPEYSMGFVYLPALLGVGLLSILLAPLGAKCAHSLPSGLLQRIFALGLIMIAMILILS